MRAPGGCWRSWRATGWRRGGWSWKGRRKPRPCCGSWTCPSRTCRSSSCLAARCCGTRPAASCSTRWACPDRPTPICRRVRSAGRRRRPRRPGGRRLRRVRRDGDDTGRGHRARRPGRNVVPDRELAGFPGRPVRRGAGGTRGPAGGEVRRAHQAGIQSGVAGVGLGRAPGQRSTTAMRSRRSRSSSPPVRATTGCPWTGWPSSKASASITRPRRWKPRHAAGSPVAIVGGGNSAGQAALFLSRTCAAGAHHHPGRDAGLVHVALPDRPDRAAPPHFRRGPHAGHCAHRGRSARGRGTAGRQPRQTSALAVRGLFVFIGAQPSTAVAGGPARRRRPTGSCSPAPASRKPA